MDNRYELYCLANPVFYDVPYHVEKEFAILDWRLPDGWQRARAGQWTINIPPSGKIPEQGWKIHVSACLDNAERTLTQVWQYCVPRDIHFKFLSSRMAVLIRNAKYAPRGSSGKAVTIYPADEAACQRILGELNELIGGARGPYILSDLRYGDGPLYVRYGGFTSRFCPAADGEMVPAIENAAGELVPDERGPSFKPPPWVELPAFLAPHLAARSAVTMAGLPYELTKALHFSNGGGVYCGIDKRTGDQVVLKEARPHAGLAADGSDAVTRLGREHDILRKLAGLDVAPQVRDYFTVGDHHFLVQEFIEGVPLNNCYADRYPLTTADPDPARIAEYTGWALRICAEVQSAVDAIHKRGVIFNDLHMFNIMVRPDDTVTLIDFEAASLAGEDDRRTVGNPGFAAPRDRTGFGIDRYSLACVRLALFMPLTMLFSLDGGKAAQLASVIDEQFPVPSGFTAEAVREIAGEARAQKSGAGEQAPARSVYAWPQLSADLVAAIRASATPAREDRLFPGDIEQFAAPGGGLGLAHGAAGVLYALAACAGVRVPEYEDWLLARAAEPPSGCRLGLYDGLAGVAYVLSFLGHDEAALRLAGLCAGERWDRLGADLHGGLAGFALALLAVGDQTGEPALLDAGLSAARLAADRGAAGDDRERRPAGLLRGAAGRALLFIKMFERTADTGYLDAAQRAIAADLSRCVTSKNGALQVDDGWRTLPYLGGGSAGIGIVIDQYLRHRDSDAFAAAGASIRIAARSAFYVQSGLFNGRAGMIVYLAGADRDDPHIAAHVRRLAWHAVPYRSGIAYPGEMLLRLSMDLGSGTAGVLLAMAAALTSAGARMPFLGPALTVPGARARDAVSEPVIQRR